jgi:hypothetical protein
MEHGNGLENMSVRLKKKITSKTPQLTKNRIAATSLTDLRPSTEAA